MPRSGSEKPSYPKGTRVELYLKTNKAVLISQACTEEIISFLSYDDLCSILTEQELDEFTQHGMLMNKKD